MKMPGPRSRTKSSVHCSPSSQRGMAIVCRRSLSLLMLGVALITVLPTAAFAQNLLLDALNPASNTPSAAEAAPPEVPPVQAIEAALAEARTRLAALKGGVDLAADPEVNTRRVATGSVDVATRLVRVLEQRREAQIQIDALRIGKAAIESGLARNPSEIVADPPPFPIPIFDGVFSAWQNATRHEKQHRNVLDDRRANVKSAQDRAQDLAKERRRLTDVLQDEKGQVERIRLETELRAMEDRIAIADQQTALAEQKVASASIEQEIRLGATRQAQAALDWVESQLVPRPADLTDAIERLDRERLRTNRALELARARLTSAEGTLRATESRAIPSQTEAYGDYTIELSTRQTQLAHRQRITALLGERLERLERMRVAWQHRYKVLGEGLDLEEAPAWRAETESVLDRLTRLRRIHEAELAEMKLASAKLLTRTTEFDPKAPNASRFLQFEFDDLDELVSLYEADLADLDSAIGLENRLQVELSARMKNRDFGERLRGIGSAALSFWTYELTTSEDSPITPGKIVIALSVFFLGLWLARVLRTQLRHTVFPRFGFDHGASSAFASLTFYALLAITFLLALRAVNIPLTAFAVAGGALAIGIGFGSQTVLSNFISGLLLLAERPIRTGDLVDIGGVVGTVESIGLRSTRIRTPDNFHIIVPNASFLESNVVNWTHEDPMLRLRVKIGVAYGSPTRKVEELLIQAAAEHPRCRTSPTPTAIFSDFGDSALLFEVRFWIRYDEQTDRAGIQSDVRYRIDELFGEAGIIIAFPQLDVHVDVSDRDRGNS